MEIWLTLQPWPMPVLFRQREDPSFSWSWACLLWWRRSCRWSRTPWQPTPHPYTRLFPLCIHPKRTGSIKNVRLFLVKWMRSTEYSPEYKPRQLPWWGQSRGNAAGSSLRSRCVCRTVRWRVGQSRGVQSFWTFHLQADGRGVVLVVKQSE